jgi:sirohydrochlorin ferrochelatase
VPYFIGPSDALTAYVPERMAGLRRRWPDLAVRIAPPLLDPQDPGDERMIDVVEERVRRVLAVLPAAPTQAAVALVDHGSPQPKVTALRNFVAERLQRRLGASVRAVAACSMERREGARYAFGDPLLAALLETPEFSSGPVIVAMLFLSPGRHAGPEGDVARLCRGAEERHPDLRTTMTELLGVHPKLVEILADRIERVLD